MAYISTKAEFLATVKRKLGEPVVLINLDDDQFEDAIDEAIQRFCELHHHGVEHDYLHFQCTSDIASNRRIPLSGTSELERVSGVTKVLNSTAIGLGSGTWSTEIWQLTNTLINDSGFTPVRASDYLLFQQRIKNIRAVAGAKMPYSFNKYMRNIELKFTPTVGTVYTFEVWKDIDPRIEGCEAAWNDNWLRDYAAAKVKFYWANVLMNLGDVAMPGDVRVSANDMLSQANDEMAALEERLQNEYRRPCGPLWA